MLLHPCFKMLLCVADIDFPSVDALNFVDYETVSIDVVILT
jgi:hypothetical protein